MHYVWLTLSVLLTPSLARAAELCSVEFTLIAASDSSFIFLERGGDDCSGLHLKWITVSGSRVSVRRELDSKAASAATDGANYISKDISPSNARELMFSPEGWTLSAPDSVLDPSFDLRVNRPPETHGFRAQPIYWDEFGKYVNYGLKQAFFNRKHRIIVLVTHSDWRRNELGYDMKGTPGDGIIVLRVMEEVRR